MKDVSMLISPFSILGFRGRDGGVQLLSFELLYGDLGFFLHHRLLISVVIN